MDFVIYRPVIVAEFWTYFKSDTKLDSGTVVVHKVNITCWNFSVFSDNFLDFINRHFDRLVVP